MRRVIVGLLVAAGALSAQINLGSLDALAAKAKESANITLTPDIIKLASGFIAADKGKGGQDISALLSGLKGIAVRAFEFDGRGKYQMSDLDPVVAQLTSSAGWNKIVSAKDGDEIAEIYVRTIEGQMAGITIIAAEPSELAVVSIDGPIDLMALKNLGGLGIPDVSNLLPQLKQQPKQKGKEK